MYYILQDDIDSECLGHIIPGHMLNQRELDMLMTESDEPVNVKCFKSEKLLLEWNACQDCEVTLGEI